MVQPIHFLHFKHQTCRTAKGQRRSPVQGISYDSDMMLLDKTTGNVIYRKHTDNTTVIYSEIISAPSCKYSDTSVPLNKRRTEMWNELYAENKNDDERIRAYCELAIPNFLTDEEMVELAKNIGNYFATKFKRPCDLSVHKKPGNNHMHLSLPERAYKDGQWLQKRKKYYLDKEGNPILDKVYKDKNGWDIRKPKIDRNLVPTNEMNEERRDKNGNYKYQKTINGRKQWFSTTNIDRFLKKKIYYKYTKILIKL